MNIKKEKDILDASSQINRHTVLFFLFFILYSLVTTLSVKDVQLLVPSLGVRLPLLDINIPIFWFFVIVPVLILIFHVNVLLHIREHYHKLKKWIKSEGDKNLSELFTQLLPFFIDFALVSAQKHSKQKKDLDKKKSFLQQLWSWLTAIFTFNGTVLLFRVVFISTIYLLPVSTLSIIFWRFADYQSIYESLFHLLILLVDVLCIYYLHKNVLQHFMKVRLLLNGIMFLVGIGGISFWIVLFLTVNKPIKLQELITAKPKTEIQKKFQKVLKLAIPHITIKSTEEVPLPSLEQWKEYNNLSKKDSNENDIDYIPRLDLSHRDLNFAQLSGTYLPYVNLNEAQLQVANLNGAYLQGATLRKANLTKVNLGQSILRHADLRKIILNNADLWNADLYNANLRKANLFGSNLAQVNLSNSNLVRVDARYANFVSANFQNAILWKSYFNHSNMAKANFYASYIDNTEFICVDTQGTHIENSIIFNNKFNIDNQQTVCKKDTEYKKNEFEVKQNIDLKSQLDAWSQSLIDTRHINIDFASKLISCEHFGIPRLLYLISKDGNNVQNDIFDKMLHELIKIYNFWEKNNLKLIRQIDPYGYNKKCLIKEKD